MPRGIQWEEFHQNLLKERVRYIIPMIVVHLDFNDLLIVVHQYFKDSKQVETMAIVTWWRRIMR